MSYASAVLYALQLQNTRLFDFENNYLYDEYEAGFFRECYPCRIPLPLRPDKKQDSVAITTTIKTLLYPLCFAG